MERQLTNHPQTILELARGRPERTRTIRSEFAPILHHTERRVSSSTPKRQLVRQMQTHVVAIKETT